MKKILGSVVALAALTGLTLACSTDEAKEKASVAKARAAAVAGEAAGKGKEVAVAGAKAAAEATGDLASAIELGLRIKREVDAVYQSESDYDLAVATETLSAGDLAAHERAIAAMPNVTIAGVTVGYEEQSERSLRGVSYARHFRATYVKDGQKVGMSYYSREAIDPAAFVALLERMIPVVEKHL